ncbi:MAG: hypothetical protein LBQ61_03665 [Spirochaetales bacterium]|nr:hypothetical protein [Spirochaetales bacterium]
MKHKGGLSVLLALLVILVLGIGLSSCKDEPDDPGITMDTNLIGVWEQNEIIPPAGELTARQAVVEVNSDRSFNIYIKSYYVGAETPIWAYVKPDWSTILNKEPIACQAFEEARTNGAELELGLEENGAWSPGFFFTYALTDGNTKLNLEGDPDQAQANLFYGDYTKKSKTEVLVDGTWPPPQQGS